MTAAVWRKGENSPLAAASVAASVTAAAPVELAALLVTADGRARSDVDLLLPGHRATAGVTLREAPAAVVVDLAAVPGAVARILVVASLGGAAATGQTFGRLPAPVAHLHAAGGGPIGTFTITGLDRERAIVALEFYRRDGGWKVRAVGQGFAGGLADLVAAHGIAALPAARPALRITVPPHLQPPPEADQQERRYDQLWGVFEDAARSAAAFGSAADFAAERLDRELSALVADPATRTGAGAEAARRQAQQRHDELVARAGADRSHDTVQLLAELAAAATDLAAPMGPWSSPAWVGWRPPPAPTPAVLLGELHLPDAPELRIPYLMRLPQRRPLGIEAGGGAGRAARQLAAGLTVRLLAAHPAGALTVQVADLAGRGAPAGGLEPLVSAGAGVVAPPVTTPAGLATLLESLVTRVDLARMATRGGACDLGPGGARSLVVLHDFPFGLDERGLLALRLLAEAGPGSGVDLLLVADPADVAAAGSEAQAVWQGAHRLPAVPDDCLADPWVGLVWTFLPDAPPPPDRVAGVLAGLAAPARRDAS